MGVDFVLMPPGDALMNRVKASIIDSFADFISIANTDREIIYYNPAAYRMIGYTEDELPKINTTAKLHAEGFDDFARTVIQPSVFKNGSWNGISAIRHKDGHTIMVDMTVFPLYAEDGTAYGTVAVIRDVDELTKTNERLEKSSQLFQKVLDSAGIGIVLINMESNEIEMVNQFACDLLMMRREEIVHHKCYDILCHRSFDICPHVNERDKDVLVSERFLERKDGTRVPIIKTGTWIKIDEKDYLVDTFVDISIQKELEKNIQEAKIAAEAANRSKSEFLSRMSHEMRTPLNAIIGMAQISEKTDDAAKLKNAIDTIKLSSAHLLGIINDVLDLSKIEEGKLELTLEPFSVKAMMKKIHLLIRPKAEEKDLDFTLDVDERLSGYVIGDSLRLSQVLLNFLSNAVKFTPKGQSIRAEVALTSISDAGIRLKFSVSDKGIGISGEQLARLFNPFTQADGSITRKYGGTGLGLAISKRLINLMGADIEVTSREGQGSCFSFEIDLPIAADGASENAKAPAFNMDAFAGKRVLMVDDVELNRLIAIELLKETGIQFDEAHDGKQAVDMATRTRYDLILMDIQMPVMDGYQATRLIRKASAPYCTTPIIAMSANVFKEDVEQSKAEGMDAHIGKPIDVEKLIAVMAKTLCQADAGAQVQETARAASFSPRANRGDYDQNLFGFKSALIAFGANDASLAKALKAFIQKDLYGQLRLAMSRQDYERAKDTAKALSDQARSFSLNALSSYASHVFECLERGETDYAAMYQSDLEKYNARTMELLSELLN